MKTVAIQVVIRFRVYESFILLWREKDTIHTFVNRQVLLIKLVAAHLFLQ